MANVPYIGANGNQVDVNEILLPDGKWYPLKPESFSLFMEHLKDESGRPFPGSESLCFTAEMEETGESISGPYASIQAMKCD